jgi:hypothetical protein
MSNINISNKVIFDLLNSTSTRHPALTPAQLISTVMRSKGGKPSYDYTNNELYARVLETKEELDEDPLDSLSPFSIVETV